MGPDQPPPLPFPSIPIAKLNEFRGLIENDKFEKVQELIWSNPRYLINYASDNPTIIKISALYNAVHIAVRTGSTQSLRYILKSIDSIKFMALAYPTADQYELEEKRQRMLDLYLNTPDKVTNNAPLHFACINGFIECVRILLEYVPKCDIEYRNKFGKSCRDVIKDDGQAGKIAALLAGCMYVAVVRSNDQLDYRLPQPFFGKKTLEGSYDPRSFHVSALAGPMSPQCAEVLYRNIASRKHAKPEHREMRLRDPVSGLEKVVQELTFEMDVDFEQYLASGKKDPVPKKEEEEEEEKEEEMLWEDAVEELAREPKVTLGLPLSIARYVSDILMASLEPFGK